MIQRLYLESFRGHVECGGLPTALISVRGRGQCPGCDRNCPNALCRSLPLLISFVFTPRDRQLNAEMDTTESAASVPAMSSETRVSTDTQNATKKDHRGILIHSAKREQG